jgi:hypothetical protein
VTGKAPGSVVKLHADASRNGGAPEPGDVLETSTGRRYLIDTICGTTRRRHLLVCVVMHPDDDYPTGAVVWRWKWTTRNRTAG